jgi:predicted ATPase/class 3 adenylate cyclase
MSSLPTGTVTFLFTDIEGSTKLAQEHRETWESLRARHHAILQAAMDAHHGYVFQIIGDAICVAFHTAGDALRAAAKSQIDLLCEKWGDTPIRVRMGIHTGKAEIQSDGQYQGYLAMSRVQRLISAGYGGQVLISLATQQLVREDLPEEVTLRDIGERRLKDLVQPEHVFQLVISDLPADFPPIKTLDSYRHNLPIQLTSFFGREREMTEIKQALVEHHLVTLTGSGGVGKTRLSLQVAADLLDQFPDGVWFVELASITDPNLIPQTILTAAQMQTQQGITALETLTDFLREKTSLLILDNCEHLLEASAKLANALLHAAPNLKILSSSREALGVSGEQAWRVPSLSIPDLKSLPPTDKLSQFESVRLFIERAMLVQSNFVFTTENAPAVAQICYRLDGIPLAIELAAARVNVLRVEQIAERLNDRFRLLTGGSRTALPRQQTLRAMIDWSYDLLSENEQILLRRLSVFSDGCTFEAVEQVCSDGKIHADDILDLLSHLVDKSLIIFDEHADQTRYRMLETIRQYARDKLLEAGEGENVRKEHLKFFLKVAEDAEPGLTGSQQIIWLDNLEVNHGNLRAGLEWSLDSDVEAGLRLGAALWRFWLVRGYLTEGLEWLEQLLSVPGSARPAYMLSRAKALYVASHLSLAQGTLTKGLALAEESLALSRKTDNHQQLAYALAIKGHAVSFFDDLARAETFYNESLELFRNAKDESGATLVLGYMGALAHGRDDMHQAKTLFEECLHIQKKMGDKWKIIETLNNLGQISRVLGNFAGAIEMHAMGLDLARELGSKTGIAYTLNLLAWTLRERGDFERAGALYKECLVLAHELGQKTRIAGVLNGLGIIAWRQGNLENARTLLEESLDYRSKMGSRAWIAFGKNNLGDVLRSQGNVAQAEILYREALTAYGDMHTSKWDVSEGLRRIAGAAVEQKQAKRAAKLFGAVEVLGETVSFFLPPLDRADLERDVAAARAQLDESTFYVAWDEGHKMTLDQAIAFALEDKQ